MQSEKGCNKRIIKHIGKSKTFQANNFTVSLVL